jgi:leucyl aminopeptidase
MKKGTTKALHTSEVGLTKPGPAVIPKIDVQASEVDVEKWKGDILVLGVFEGSLEKNKQGEFENAELRKLDEFVGGLLKEITSEEDFTGKPGQSSFARLAGYGFKRVGLVGIGKVEASESSTKPWKSLGESVATASKTSQAHSVAILLLTSSAQLSENTKVAAASAITSGLVLGSFEDTRFRSEYKSSALEKVELIGLGVGKELQDQISRTVYQCAGVILARQLVNSPANVLTPSVLADEAENIAAAHDDVLLAKILDKEECEALKMGAYLGVAAASTNPPKFIHLRYTPPSGDVKTKLAVVGKGLTFDSGGYNIKTGPGSMIEVMKFDMGGAAAVFGAAKAIATIKPPGVEVLGTRVHHHLSMRYPGKMTYSKFSIAPWFRSFTMGPLNHGIPN